MRRWPSTSRLSKLQCFQQSHRRRTAFAQAETLPQTSTSTHPPPPPPPPLTRKVQPDISRVLPTNRPDPFTILGPHLSDLRTSLLTLLTSGHHSLTETTEYYFLHPSKQIRPIIILLLARATNGLGSSWDRKLRHSSSPNAGGHAEDLDKPLTRPDVLNDWNPSMPRGYSLPYMDSFSLDAPKSPRGPPYAFEDDFGRSQQAETSNPSPSTPRTPTKRSLHPNSLILPTQLRLAQIVEMVHAASLLHDDVIDESPLRRGMPSAPSAFGNKRAVLAGNFVLGRASTALSRLGDAEVTELIASVISNLVEGEILQMREVQVTASSGEGGGEAAKRREAWNVYIQKTYLKTASLMAKGARAAVALGGCVEGDIYREIAYAYGRNLGIAFQLVDDVLDYESAAATLGKPGGADLQLGLATGPALYAWEEHPQLGELIGRKFEKEGDVQMAREMVLNSKGVERTRVLAQSYVDKAKEVLSSLPDSEAKGALEVLADRVIGRKS